MKWTEGQVSELKTLCFAETPNADIAEYFSIPVAEIHAKRSQIGITQAKVKAAQPEKGQSWGQLAAERTLRLCGKS